MSVLSNIETSIHTASAALIAAQCSLDDINDDQGYEPKADAYITSANDELDEALAAIAKALDAIKSLKAIGDN